MVNNLYKFTLIVLGMTICCPYVFSSCDFKMEKIQYFHQNNTAYKINLNISEVCSNNALQKRNMKQIEMNIFKNDRKVATFDFSDGLWMPTQSKFLLRRKNFFSDGCFKGFKNLTLNLKNNFLNSIDGLFLNLESGNSLKINCQELKKSS